MREQLEHVDTKRKGGRRGERGGKTRGRKEEGKPGAHRKGGSREGKGEEEKVAVMSKVVDEECHM